MGGGVFPRPGNTNPGNNNKVCFNWRAGKCSRFPCPFLHRDLKTEKVCNFWIQGNCGYGDKCGFLHSWSTPTFSLLTQLQGHNQVVSGIALPSGSDKLYTGSIDKTVRVWDCQSGQCAGVINLAGEVGCMLSEGPWVFVGLPNVVKAWNSQTSTDLSLSGPVGQVYALVVVSDLLFAGTQVWSLETLQCAQTLTEHTATVIPVLCWDQFLLSCSLDKTIKVWVATESGNLEVTYTHNEEYGIITGDGTGEVRVWMWSAEPTATA